MIIVDLKLWPLGFADEETLLGFIKIWNDGTGSKTKGNYCYTLVKKNKIKTEGRITSFPRKRKDAFNLLWLVLKDVYEKEKK